MYPHAVTKTFHKSGDEMLTRSQRPARLSSALVAVNFYRLGRECSPSEGTFDIHAATMRTESYLTQCRETF